MFLRCFLAGRWLAHGALICSICATFGVALPALAQGAASELVITGNPLQREQLVSPVSALSGAELRERGQGSLGETLSTLPGVSSSYFGPQASRPLIRGLDGDRIRVLANGGALQDVSALSYDHAVPTDALAVDRIEVLRGPASLLYGGSAMGGVVNVIDTRIARERLQGIQGRAQWQAATGAAERSGAALLEAGTGDVVLHVDGFERRSGDVKVPITLDCAKEGAAFRASRICNSAGQARGGALGLTWLGEGSRLGVSASTHRSDYGTVADDQVMIGLQSDRYALEGEWRAPWSGVRSLELKLGQGDYRHQEFHAGTPETRFANRSSDLRLQLRHEPLGPLEGVLGLQIDAADFSARGEEAFAPTSRTRSQAVFVHEEWPTPWGQWNLGARAEQVKVRSLGLEGEDRFVPAERQFSPRSAATSALWRLAPQWHLRAGWAYTERAPRDYELFALGPHLATVAYEVGNAALQVERSRSTDLGLEWASGPNRLSASVYQSRFTDYIALLHTGRWLDVQGEFASAPGALAEQVYRGVPARFEGFELSGLRRLALSRATLDVQWRADAVRATDLASGQPLPRIAPLRWGSTLVYTRGPWTARGGFDHAAAQSRVPPQALPTGSYTLWHAGLSWRQRLEQSTLNWFARVDNLGNALAYSATSVLTSTAPGRAPLPGRSLKLGVQWLF